MFTCFFLKFGPLTPIVEAFVETPDPLPNSMTSYLCDTFNSNKLADITIKTADGKEIKAAKFVLSRSPVFDAMLNHHDTKEARKGVIQIIDINHEVLSEMVRYMYCDYTPKLKDMALELLIAANKYDIPGLLEKCKSYLRANISLENFANILICAERLQIDDLESVIMQFLIEHSETVFDSEEWQSFEENNLELANKVMRAYCKKLKGTKKVVDNGNLLFAVWRR
jgi:hypothetical protein